MFKDLFLNFFIPQEKFSNMAGDNREKQKSGNAEAEALQKSHFHPRGHLFWALSKTTKYHIEQSTWGPKIVTHSVNV